MQGYYSKSLFYKFYFFYFYFFTFYDKYIFKFMTKNPQKKSNFIQKFNKNVKKFISAIPNNGAIWRAY